MEYKIKILTPWDYVFNFSSSIVAGLASWYFFSQEEFTAKLAGSFCAGLAAWRTFGGTRNLIKLGWSYRANKKLQKELTEISIKKNELEGQNEIFKKQLIELGHTSGDLEEMVEKPEEFH